MTTAPVTAEPAASVAGSRPYAWPFDGQISERSLALLIVLGPGVDPSVAAAAEGAIRPVATATREFGARVVWVLCDGYQCELPEIGDTVVESVTGNGFIGGSLDLTLRTGRITHLAIAGWPTELAVHSTMRRANDIGYECLLIEDACTAADETLQPAAILTVQMSGGIFGATATADAFIAALRAAVQQI